MLTSAFLKILQTPSSCLNATKWLMWRKIEHSPRHRSFFLCENSSFFGKNKPKCEKCQHHHFFNFLKTLVNSSATSTLQMDKVSRQYLVPIIRNRHFKRHHIIHYGKFQVKIFLRFFGHPGCNPISQLSDLLRQPTIFVSKLLWCTLFAGTMKNSPSKGDPYLNFCLAFKVYWEACQYTLWNSNIFRFLIHSKSWYIENLRHIQNSISLFTVRIQFTPWTSRVQFTQNPQFSVTLPFKNCRHIQNPIKYI